MHRRTFLTAAFLAFSFVGLAFAADQSSIIQAQGETMGTSYIVKIYDPPESLGDDWRFMIDRELRSITDQMSTYIGSSEISRFNATDSTDWFAVSPSFQAVVARSIEISQSSQGAFDITVMPLVKAWSFGPGKKRMVPPSDQELMLLRRSVGFESLEARAQPAAIRKLKADITIDLNAIAPGYAVDRLVEILAGLGATNVFIELGGEVRVAGSKGTQPWTVGIQQPDVAGQVVAVAYPLRDRGIATSGDYRSYFEYEGKRYSHTIDPRTARPVTHELASVTVLADDCMTADALATTLSVLGPEAGKSYAKQNGLDVLFMMRSGDGLITMDATGAFIASLAPMVEPSAGTADMLPAGFDFAAFVPIALACMVALGLVVAAMAVGVMFGRRAISGSCGGLANTRDADGHVSCSLCSNPDNACKELRARMDAPSEQH